MLITSLNVSTCYALSLVGIVLPPESARTPCAVPTVGGCAVHRHCCVIILGNLLLNSQLLITLVFLFASDVGNARLLVFVHVKRVSVHSGTLHLVRRQRSVYLLLLRCLRRARAESSCTQQGRCIS